MALLDFIKEAGEKLFHLGSAPGVSSTKQSPQSASVGSSQPSAADQGSAANAAAGDAILNYIKSQNLDASGLTVTYDAGTSTATVYGVAPDQATKEKILL